MSAAPTNTPKYNPERLMTLILAPVVSEKSTYLGDARNQVILRVVNDATKPEIKAAVEWLFKVKVKDVSVLNVHGKEKRFGRTVGRQRGWKKAYVSLKPGQEINFAQEA
ncbi:MAG: 50S ribosomal protein L23 [Burkholderiales bacterium]|jgi:large subunit ribosomal protein L23|nr:50S ribosomal protein L23 [Burkholderiales bacterium]